MSELFTTSRTAQILDISTQTLKRWYKWYHDDTYKKPEELKLPNPVINEFGTMLFTMETKTPSWKDQLNENHSTLVLGKSRRKQMENINEVKETKEIKREQVIARKL